MTNPKPKKLILLDGNALVHRAYHALPPLTTKTGEPVGAVYGFAMTLLSVLEKFKPDYIAASFDLAAPTFRHEAYVDYKANRVKAPDDLYEQIPRVKELVTAFNIPIYEKEGFEADDILGTIARQASGDESMITHQSVGTDSSHFGKGGRGNKPLTPADSGAPLDQGGQEKEIIDTIIVTGDNDALQLVSPLVKVFSIRKGIKDLVLYDRDAVVGKYGFPPETLPDYKGLAGDQSDNIPGVSGIGAKTATELLKSYGSLEGVYAHLDDTKESVRKKLEADRESAFASRDLGTIRTDVPVSFDAAACVAHDYDLGKVAALFRELGFYSLLKRIGERETGNNGVTTVERRRSAGDEGRKAERKKERVLKTKEGVETLLRRAPDDRTAVWIHVGEESLFGGAGVANVEIAFSPAIPGLTRNLDSRFRGNDKGEALNRVQDDRGKEITTMTIEWNDETKSALVEFLEDEKRGKIFYDAKAIWHVLKREGIALRGISFDAMIAAYLLQAGTRVEFDHLVIAEFGEEGLERKAESLLGLSIALSEKIAEISKEQDLEAQSPGEWNIGRLFSEIEMPLIPVLAEMERSGVRLDVERFKKLSEVLGGELATLEKKIYDFAGREFNINSPKQLADILFVDLKVPTAGIKKTKTGLSTASSELEKLREYPIVSLVEEYREIAKLKSTYLDTFPSLVDDRSRLHTTYQQAVAATGRLSSVDPNLQNIPAREKWSVAIRSAFQAERGKLLVGADYSQIELRVMAHLSGDRNLVSAFERGLDVHAATASAVYGVKPEDVTPDQRREAKVFNFGLMYGMSAFGLAQSLGIDQKRAAEFIRMYFEKFPGVSGFIERMKTSVRERGFVETELGRRRYVPEMASSNPTLVHAGERMAVNMPAQGLAADIMKLAMLRAADLVSRYNGDTGTTASPRESGRVKMLLQVHDELIFEVEEGFADAFSVDVKKVMEEAYALRVPLVVETAIGKNWGEI